MNLQHRQSSQFDEALRYIKMIDSSHPDVVLAKLFEILAENKFSEEEIEILLLNVEYMEDSISEKLTKANNHLKGVKAYMVK